MTSLSAFDAASILIVMAAVLGFINHQYLRLPSAIGLTIMGALASLVVIGIDRLVPDSHLTPLVLSFLAGIDFQTTLLDGMLSFLLFAGALHVDWTEMRRGRWPIIVLSTVGVVVSTLIVGYGIYFLSDLIGLPAQLSWCFVFGALISPTDPVAVMGVLKRANVPPLLQATVAGESLFNDGVGVVVFAILVGVATGSEELSLAHAAEVFAWEAGGGVALGLAVGWLAYQAMRRIDDFNVEVMISLAVVMGGYSIAHWLHMSGPVAMAVAGLLIGNAAVADAMSATTRDYVLKFWELIDEVLNAVLFLLIGLEVIAITSDARVLLLGLLAIPLVLIARLTAVSGPLLVMRKRLPFGPIGLPTLVWGGLRGGISVALALSLPPSDTRTVILGITYVVVLFSVIVQGGSIGRLITIIKARQPASDEVGIPVTVPGH
jgi:CPA1 family monovalent cation:H+ antiporter